MITFQVLDRRLEGFLRSGQRQRTQRDRLGQCRGLPITKLGAAAKRPYEDTA